MDYQTIKELVKLFLKDPSGFIEKLKKLLENNAFNYDGNLLNLLQQEANKISKLIQINKISQTIKNISKDAIKSLGSVAKVVEEKIINGQDNSHNKTTILENTGKIAESITSDLVDVFESLIGSFWIN